jgi:hypothetical protein
MQSNKTVEQNTTILKYCNYKSLFRTIIGFCIAASAIARARTEGEMKNVE